MIVGLIVLVLLFVLCPSFLLRLRLRSRVGRYGLGFDGSGVGCLEDIVVR